MKGRSRPLSVRRLAPWLGGVVLAAGIAFASVAFWPTHHAATNPTSEATAKAPAAPTRPKAVPLTKEATAVARTFLRTAVARADLDTAWRISGANLRGGLTHAEWMTGNIPVIPYPIQSLAVARFKIDYSYRDQALIEVALLPKDGSSIKPQTFYLGLKRLPGPDGKRHWVVDDWVPLASTLVPKATN